MNQPEHGAGGHVAQYSWAPVIIASGIFFLNAGFIFGLIVGIVGLLIVLAGIFQWIREDVHIYARGSDDGQHH